MEKMSKTSTDKAMLWKKMSKSSMSKSKIVHLFQTLLEYNPKSHDPFIL